MEGRRYLIGIWRICSQMGRRHGYIESMGGFRKRGLVGLLNFMGPLTWQSTCTDGLLELDVPRVPYSFDVLASWLSRMYNVVWGSVADWIGH